MHILSEFLKHTKITICCNRTNTESGVVTEHMKFEH
jgi:hypothetical protein